MATYPLRTWIRMVLHGVVIGWLIWEVNGGRDDYAARHPIYVRIASLVDKTKSERNWV